jgi:nucleoside 2-deoxyribosyltransferase
VDKDKYRLLSGYIREHTEPALQYIYMTDTTLHRDDDFEKPLRSVKERRKRDALYKIDPVSVPNDWYEMLLSSNIPSTVDDKINKLLSFIQNDITGGQNAQFATAIYLEKDYPISYCQNELEFRSVVNFALQEELIRRYEDNNMLKKCIFTPLSEKEFINILMSDATIFISITLKGLRRIEEMKSAVSNNVFVAMSFDPSLNDLYNKTIHPAIKEAYCRLNPVRMKEEQHNGNINNKIITEIKKSRFIIADFTTMSDGVYYEAGYAHGYGLPVIFTCRQSDFKKNKKKDKQGVHFDINHENFILWEYNINGIPCVMDGSKMTTQTLKDAIIYRIQDTILTQQELHQLPQRSEFLSDS